jgi:hypothetical protein
MASIESQVRSSPSIALVGSMGLICISVAVSTTCLGQSGSSELFWNTSTAGY